MTTSSLLSFEAIRKCSARALDSGHLDPIETERHVLEQGQLRVVVRVARARAPRDRSRGRGEGARATPFLPYEKGLLVAELSDTHVCLLNRFPVIEDHLLVVTRAFEDQSSLLTRADFEALWTCLSETDGLAFYNAGTLAGASQSHKHLQLVPLPSAGVEERFPIAGLIEESVAAGVITAVEQFDFRHALAHLALPCEPNGASAESLLSTYMQLREQTGLSDDGQAYSLLATREWMLLVPRSSGAVEGVGINALGFAGSLFLSDAAQLRVVESLGLLEMLAAVSVPR